MIYFYFIFLVLGRSDPETPSPPRKYATNDVDTFREVGIHIHT